MASFGVDYGCLTIRSDHDLARHQRHGLWRAGSTGIAQGLPGVHLFSADAWARFDNVWVECAVNCTVRVRYRSAVGRTLAVAVGAPLRANIVASTAGPVLATNWTEIVLPVGATRTSAGAGDARAVDGSQAFVLQGQPVYLMLDGGCEIDYFWFAPNVAEI